MTRAHRLLALILCVALLCAVWAPMVGAEPSDALGSLTQGVGMPDTYTLEVTPPLAEGADAKMKELTVNCTAANNASVNVQLQLSFFGFANLEAEWSQRAENYTQSIARLMAGQSDLDPRSLAAEIKAELNEMHLQGAKASADEAIRIHTIQVTAPYYAQLEKGARGDDVLKLQNRLIELGFLDGGADGQFGSATQKGVEALQAHIRALEQEIIDESTPQPTPMPTPDPSAEATETPEATSGATPKPEPQTRIDGIAGAQLLAYLYSDRFTIAGPTLRLNDKGDAVLRLQKRLVSLGCLTGKPDGVYGGDTQRGIWIFQHYNNLPESGEADRDTQTALYASDAKKPPFPLMSEGSKGDEVRLVQERLKQLGFMVGTVDGGYGAATVTGVKNLQAYMKNLEARKQSSAANIDLSITQSANAAAVNTDQPGTASYTTDGVVDPMLADAFFADDFPVVPDDMASGANGLDVQRLQRRLYDLEYLFTSADGEYGPGTEKAVSEFQKRNGLSQTGGANAATLAKLFSSSPKKALKPYVLKVSVDKQRVYAYAPDANEEYTRLVRTMKCSTGLPSTPTIKGTFQASTGPGARWHYFKKYLCWAQYAYSIQGNYLFHSVLYNTKGGPVTRSSVNNLGRRASHGCVRLSVEDAKWIWTNCPKRTKIVVY